MHEFSRRLLELVSAPPEVAELVSAPPEVAIHEIANTKPFLQPAG